MTISRYASRLSLLPPLLLLACSAPPVRVPLTGPVLDSLRARADTLCALGRPEESLSLYHAVLEDRPGDPGTLSARGHAFLALRRWSDASDDADDALEADSSHLGAHYVRGVAERELGINQFLRIGWRTAEKEFRYVEARDSTFEDVLMQHALLMRYREEYREAIDLGQTAIRLIPHAEAQRASLLSLYRVYVAMGDSAGVLPWLRSRPGAFDRFCEAEILRRSGQHVPADRILDSLLRMKTPLPPQAPLLARAKIARALGENNRAEQLYQQALDGVEDQAGVRILFDDVKVLLTDAELATYRHLREVGALRDFLRAVWAGRNPEQATGRNPRIVEHLRRSLVAEEQYEYSGFRSFLNNPDWAGRLKFPESFSLNTELNDMGVITLRHGTPSSTIRGGMGSEHDPQESWLYEGSALTPRLIFHFQKHNAAGNNWRLTDMPTDFALLEDLQLWDSRYVRMVRGNSLDRASTSEQLAAESATQVTHALTTDEQTWERPVEPVRIPHAVDVFRAADGQGMLDVSYAIPLGMLWRAGGDSVQFVRAEVGVSVRTSAARPVASRLDTMTFRTRKGAEGISVDLYRFTVPPDSYSVALHLRGVEKNLFGTWTQGVRVPDYSRPRLMLSSTQILIPATRVSALEINGVRVMQSPFRGTPRRQKLYVYFQVYNLIRDDAGNAAYTTEALLVPRGEDQGDEISIGTETRSLRNDTGIEFQTLDISRVSSGTYRLLVRVTDRNRVATVTSERELVVRD